MTDNIITARLFIDMDGSTGTWKGASVSRFNTPETLAKLIWQSILAHTNTRD